jgi:hypothetical protein
MVQSTINSPPCPRPCLCQNCASCSITYDFGTKNETLEWLDTQAYVQAGDLKLLNDRVELRNYPNSRAVQNSSVLNPKQEFGDDSGGGGGSKKGSKYSVGPTGRKRLLASYDFDSDDI